MATRQPAQTAAHDMGGGEFLPVLWDPTTGNLYNQAGTLITSSAGGQYTATVPVSSTAPGTAGQYSGNATYFFYCYAPNLWRRVSSEAF